MMHDKWKNCHEISYKNDIKIITFVKKILNILEFYSSGFNSMEITI